MQVDQHGGSFVLVQLDIGQADIFEVMVGMDETPQVLWTSPNFFLEGDQQDYLPNDPDQVENLAGDPEKAEVLKQLGARLDERLEALNDPRATDPKTTVFDGHPYFGGGGGKK